MVMSKMELKALVATRFADNTTRDISEVDARFTLDAIIDNLAHTTDIPSVPVTPGTPTTETYYLGLREADASFGVGDYTVSEDNVTLSVPNYSGRRFMSVAYPATETIQAIYIYQPGHRVVINVLQSFPTIAALELGGVDQLTRSSVDSFDGYSGYIVELEFA